MLDSLSGDLRFENRRMDVDIYSGDVLGGKIKHAHAEIPHLSFKSSHLNVNGLVNADLKQGMGFIHQSPLEKSIGKKMRGMELSGPMNLNLDLTIPLAGKSVELTSDGSIVINKGTLDLPDWNLKLEQLNGNVKFDRTTLSSDKLKANIFGNPATLSIKPDKLGETDTTFVDLKGSVSATSLQNYLKYPVFNLFEGEADYQAGLHIPHGGENLPHHLFFKSPLKGMQIGAPKPFGKMKSETVNLNLVSEFGGNANANIQFSLDKRVEALMEFIPAEKNWFVTLSSQDVVGHVKIPAGDNNGIIQGQFTRLHLTPFLQNEDKTFAPASVPSFYLTSKDFKYGDRAFGKVEFNVANEKDRLLFNKILIDNADYQLSMVGFWNKTPDVHLSNLKGVFSSQRTKGLFEKLNLADALKTKQLDVDFDLSWPGDIYAPEINKMEGELNIALGPGRILEVGDEVEAKMEVGKLLNLLSPHTLIRRLNLDFSDLTHDGFSFDEMKGQFVLSDGNAQTRDTYFDGPIAHVALKGRIGLSDRDFDLKLNIIPYVTSSLPVIATIAGGPIAGIATWIADRVFTTAMKKNVDHYYAMKGSWDDPIVEKLNN